MARIRSMGLLAILLLMGGGSAFVAAHAMAYREPAWPEFEISALGVLIENGDSSPDGTDGTDFGPVNGTVVHTFSIYNKGRVGFVFDATGIVVGTNAEDFVAVPSPSIQIEPGQRHEFQIRFTPGATGIRTARIAIFAAYEAQATAYGFAIQGAGNGPPEMEVSGKGVAINDGDSDPGSSDGTDFGKAGIYAGTATRPSFRRPPTRYRATD